ncbi:rhoptry neck protein [Cystoisospora suis]|uniref:Rhoptry neck protein n=1 Tax=Cystoisospora suis TaxID=483139 RepID=A0A2C6KJB6_9APIC|nr:rhoptry neck protein [Cystoisospora suis]
MNLRSMLDVWGPFRHGDLLSSEPHTSGSTGGLNALSLADTLGPSFVDTGESGVTRDELPSEVLPGPAQEELRAAPSPVLPEGQAETLLGLGSSPEYNIPAPTLVRDGGQMARLLEEEFQKELASGNLSAKATVETPAQLSLNLEELRSMLEDPDLEAAAKDSNAPQEESLGRERDRLSAKLKRIASALGFTQFGMHQAISGTGVSKQEGQEAVSDVAAVDDLREAGATTEPGKTRISGLAGEEGPVTPYIVGLIATSNPYLLTRILVIGAAFLGYDRYFGDVPSRLLPFYGPQTLLATLSPISTPLLLDPMADAERVAPRSILGKLRKRPSAAEDALTESGWNRQRRSRLPLGSHRLVLDMLDRHLEALWTCKTEVLKFAGTSVVTEEQIGILQEEKIPVEASIPMADNLSRLHINTCRQTVEEQLFPCEWQDTFLYERATAGELPTLSEQDISTNRVKAQRLETAFNTITGLGFVSPQAANTQVARLFSDYRLGAAGRNVLKPYGLDSLLSLSAEGATLGNRSAVDTADAAEVERKLASHHNYRSALRARLYVMALRKTLPRSLHAGKPTDCQTLSPYNPYRNSNVSPVQFIHEVFSRDRDTVMMMARFKPVLADDLINVSVPDGFSYLWLFEFLLDDDSPNGMVERRQALTRSPKWASVLYSHRGFRPQAIRRLYKRIKTGITKQARQRNLAKAKTMLVDGLPSGWQEMLIDAFSFTAHSSALMQVINYHSLYRDETIQDVKEATYLTAPPTTSIQAESVVKRCDRQIYVWSREGLSPDILEADKLNKTFKGKWASIKLEALPMPDTRQWWRRLHRTVLEALQKYQSHEKHLENLNDNLYTLVSDTVRMLEEDGAADNTIFLGRVAKRARGTLAQRVGRGIKSFFLGLVRDVPATDHAVWFGVNFSMTTIFSLLRRMREIAQSTDDKSAAVLLDEAFMQLVEETVALRTESYRRQPPAASRNLGVIGLRPDYGTLDLRHRSAEYQLSMCADHCNALWRQVLAAVYPYVLNPSLLEDYDKSFGTQHALDKLDDPSYVNSFRYIFTSDAALNFWEYTTPRETKKELMALKDGQALLYANMMRFAGLAYEQLNFRYLAGSLQRQAPFMGQMVKDWIAKRSRARKLAIVGVLSLGLMFVYTALSALDIAQNLIDSGMKTVEDCVWNPIMQEMACVVVPGSGVVVAPIYAAISDVFHVGLYAGIGSTIMSAVGIGSLYLIVRSESRTVLRLEMAIKELALKLWRRVRQFFSWATRFRKRRHAILTTMQARAVALARKREGPATLTDSGIKLVDSFLQDAPPEAREGERELTASPALE